MPITVYNYTSSYKAGSILATTNALLSCKLQFDNSLASVIQPTVSALSAVGDINNYIYRYGVCLYGVTSAAILTSINPTPTSRITINSTTGVINLSASAPTLSSFRLVSFARDLSTYETKVLTTEVPIDIKDSSIITVPNLSAQDLLQELLVQNVNLPLGSIKSFRLAFAKETYSEFDRVIARYVNYDYTSNNWTIGNSITAIESIILSKEFSDTEYKWRLVKGIEPNYTVMYTLSTNYEIEDLFDGANIFVAPIDGTNATWIPKNQSYDPITVGYALPYVDDSFLELPVINNPDIIFIENKNSLVHFRIDASYMDEMYLGFLSESIVKYKVEEVGSSYDSKISKNIFVDHSTGRVFANILGSGKTSLKISATNKNGTTSKIIDIVIGSYEEGSTNFNVVSSLYYPISTLLTLPEIDHVIRVTTPYSANQTITFNFANKKPTTELNNFYFTTYTQLSNNSGNDSGYPLLGLEYDNSIYLTNDVLVETSKNANANVPLIRRFDTPIEFGSNRQQMYWGIVAKEISNINRDSMEWNDENVPYLFVNPISSHTIPLTGWLKSNAPSIRLSYTAYDARWKQPTLSAFYSSNIHASIYGDISTIGSLVTANNLNITSEYYTRAQTLQVWNDYSYVTEEKNVLVKVNTDVDLINNYDPFEYTNSYIIDTKTTEYNKTINNFWSKYSKITTNQFDTPAPSSLVKKYINASIAYSYKPYELLEYKANFLNSLLNKTSLSLNYAVILDNKAWVSVEPPVADVSTFLINAGYQIPLSGQQTATFDSYSSLPDGENRLKKLYWSSNDINTFPRIIGNKNGIGHFGSLSAKCYWGIQNDGLTFSAVNPNIGNLSSFEFPMSGWLTTFDLSSFKKTSQYINLTSTPPLLTNAELSPKLFYASITTLPIYNQLSGVLVQHGSALVFRGKVTPSDFILPEGYLNKATRYNTAYISTDPAVAYGTDLRFGNEQVGVLRALGYM